MSKFMKLPKPSNKSSFDISLPDPSINKDISLNDRSTIKKAGIFSILICLILIVVFIFSFFKVDDFVTYDYSSNAFKYAGGFSRYVKHTVLPMNPFIDITYVDMSYSYNKNYFSRVTAVKAFCYESEYCFITVEIDESYWDYYMDCNSNNYPYIDIPFQYLDISIYGILGASSDGSSYTWELLSDFWYSDLTVEEIYNDYRNIPVGVDAAPVRVKVFDNGVYDPTIMDYTLTFPEFDWASWLGSLTDYLKSIQFKFAYKNQNFNSPIGTFHSYFFQPVISRYEIINVSSFDFSGKLSSINYGLSLVGDPPSIPDPDDFNTDLSFVASYFKWVVREIIYLFKVVFVFVREAFV